MMTRMGARTAGFTLRTECTSCGMPLPLDRPAQEVTCGQCQATVRVPDEVWQFAVDAFEGDKRPPPGKMRTLSETVRGFRLHLQVANLRPHCEHCATAYDLPDADGDFPCSRCGDPASVWTAPGWLRLQSPTCKRLVSIDPGGADSHGGASVDPSVADEVAPVAMQCPQCAASLRITAEHERIVPCQYCHTDVFLPDEVWRRLHPVKTVQWWFAVFEGKTAANKQRDAHDAAVAEERAAEKRRAEAAFRQVPAAWAATAVFGAWQIALPFVVLRDALELELAALISVALYVIAIVFAAAPSATADGSSRFARTVVCFGLGAIFMPPVAGIVFALILLAFALWLRDGGKPASGVGRPLVFIYVVGTIPAQFLFFYLSS